MLGVPPLGAGALGAEDGVVMHIILLIALSQFYKS
jgi:hypothetical protein